jgi:hypothetical protein
MRWPAPFNHKQGRASSYGSEGWGFESLRARKRIRRSGHYLELSPAAPSVKQTGFCHTLVTRA